MFETTCVTSQKLTFRVNPQTKQNLSGRNSGPKNASKTRTGCMTCKARRVKCGEEKPVCRNCSAFGRKCGGYEFFRTVSFNALPNKRERWSFDYFLHRVVPDFDNGPEQGFWNGPILQSSDLQPAVKHLCVALGSIHEGLAKLRMDHGASLQESRIFALHHYSKASSILGASTLPVAHVLVACVLFIHFEELHTDLSAAAQHLQSGLEILANWNKWKADEDVPRTHLQALMLSLALQYAPVNEQISAGASKLLVDSSLDFLGNCKPCTPTFTTIEAARRCLDGTITCMLNGFTILAAEDKNTWTAVSPLLQLLRQKLQQWSVGFEESVPKLRLPTCDVKSIALHLKVRCRLALVLVQTFPFNDEMGFDNFTPDFQNIVDITAEYLSVVRNRTTPAGHHPFISQTRLLWPLYIVGTSCRHPIIRRRAMELLRTYDIQEGPWCTDAVACAVQVIINIEERGLVEVRDCSDVPERSRISCSSGRLLGGKEYVPLSHEKRNRVICWMQMEYVRQLPGSKNGGDHRVNLTRWSSEWRSSPSSQDELAEAGDHSLLGITATSQRKDMQVLFECKLDLASVCRCI